MTRNQQVAATILAQLGGHQFAVMTGMKNALTTENGVQFSIGRGAKNGINKVVVTLTPSDTYDVTFYRISRRGLTVNVIAKREFIYCDQLREVFTNATGFYTSLGGAR